MKQYLNHLKRSLPNLGILPYIVAVFVFVIAIFMLWTIAHVGKHSAKNISRDKIVFSYEQKGDRKSDCLLIVHNNNTVPCHVSAAIQKWDENEVPIKELEKVNIDIPADSIYIIPTKNPNSSEACKLYKPIHYNVANLSVENIDKGFMFFKSKTKHCLNRYFDYDIQNKIEDTAGRKLIVYRNQYSAPVSVQGIILYYKDEEKTQLKNCEKLSESKIKPGDNRSYIKLNGEYYEIYINSVTSTTRQFGL